MSAADEGRTEKATEKKRQKFREEGSVAKSQELSSFSQFLVAYIVLVSFGGMMVNGLAEIMTYGFTHMEIDVAADIQGLATLYMERALIVLAPLFAGLFLGIFIISRAQFDFQINPKALKPKFSKINPFKNFQKVLISKQSMMELAKSVSKLTILTILAWIAVKPVLTEWLLMFQFTPVQIGLKVWDVALSIWLLVIIFMGILGVADFTFQKYQLEEKMKMTKQEVKDEHKMQEGDMMTKGKLRQKGMRMLMDMMQDAAGAADVVITNPTHFAVALSYKHGEQVAPKVVAKGCDHLAMKIRTKARQKQVPIVENRGLARALYYNSEVGSEIPENLFKPVAEILAFIYKLSKEHRR